ncbi:MAG: FAD:protein FMN transferase [Runella sp.]
MKSLRLACVVLLLVGCRPKATYTHLEGQAQGTTFNISYSDSRDFAAEIDSLFRVIDRSMSLWDSTSIIRGINENRENIVLDEHFVHVFEKAQEISQTTDGAFDITVGPLVKRWGFSYKKGGTLPTQKEIDSLLSWVGYRKVRVENNRLIKQNLNIEIDFNAIAQGYTVDLVASFLEKKGIENYMVEIGGEVRAKGQNDKGQIWQIGIDKPTDTTSPTRPLQTIVALNDKALATSGSYRKFVERDGRRFSHAIDPKTGKPIMHNLLSISVIAPDCMTADAYATAFLVLGKEKTLVLAEQKGLEVYGIYEDANKELKTFQTVGFFK